MKIVYTSTQEDKKELMKHYLNALEASVIHEDAYDDPFKLQIIRKEDSTTFYTIAEFMVKAKRTKTEERSIYQLFLKSHPDATLIVYEDPRFKNPK